MNYRNSLLSIDANFLYDTMHLIGLTRGVVLIVLFSQPKR